MLSLKPLSIGFLKGDEKAQYLFINSSERFPENSLEFFISF